MRQIRLGQLSSLRQEVDMRWARVVPGKHGMSALMIALKEAEIKVESLPVHMQHKQTANKQLKDKGELTTGTVHEKQINKTTTLPLTAE